MVQWVGHGLKPGCNLVVRLCSVFFVREDCVVLLRQLAGMCVRLFLSHVPVCGMVCAVRYMVSCLYSSRIHERGGTSLLIFVATVDMRKGLLCCLLAERSGPLHRWSSALIP